MDINLTEVVVAVIGLCGSLITACLVPLIKKNNSIKNQQNIREWTGIAVRAAESIYGSGQGTKKKSYVLEYLQSKGITVDETEIEAAVYEFINGLAKEASKKQ